ncbi:MAG: hypothetical protein AMJ67_16675 [Betaproteobacteria bacterium SG8_41]|nr:MAG: hypothetical protein AMJ67_16675 [Betaproteobacteria bacterium SG8_41]
MTLQAQQAAGAQALEGLNDIVVPEPVSLLPQAPGWIALGVVAIALLVTFAVLALRRYRRNAYRREALMLVEATPLDSLPALVKRVALAAAPRAEVASLTGDDWLAFLDRSYGGDGFSDGPGRALASLSFEPSAIDQRSSADLRDLVATWIRKHRV